MTETRNILLIGRTGRGKSTLANVLSGTNKFKESSGSTSETKKIQFDKFEANNSNYLIIDTPGIGDTKLNDHQVLDIIAEAVYLVRNGVSRVLFVINGRFDQYEMITYNLLRETIFDQDITNYTTVIRTCFKDFKKEKRCKTDTDSMVKEAEDKKNKLKEDISTKKKEIEGLTSDRIGYKELFKEIKKLEKELKVVNLSEIIKSCHGKVIYVDNSPIEIAGADEDELQTNRKKRINSREKVLTHLSENCQITYKPPKLQELSDEIDDDIGKKKELENKLKNLKKELQEKIRSSKASTAALRKEEKDLKEEIEELKKELDKKSKIIRQKVRKHIHSKLDNDELMSYFGEQVQDWLNKRYDNKERTKEIILYQDEWIKGEMTIENFPNLEKINIQGEPDFKGGLSELTVKKCKQLTYLNCSNNAINLLTISECPNLKEIDCSSSPIVVLNIQGCSNLKSLVCSDDLLANLDLGDCPKLKKLECKNNSFINLDLSQNKELKELYICDNNFEKQDLSFLSHLVNLEKLYLGSNHFCGSLEPLKNLRKLKELDISGNDIIVNDSEYLDYFPNLEKFVAVNGEHFDTPRLRLLRLQIEIDKLNDELLSEKEEAEWYEKKLGTEKNSKEITLLKEGLKIKQSRTVDLQQSIDKLKSEKDNISQQLEIQKAEEQSQHHPQIQIPPK